MEENLERRTVPCGFEPKLQGYMEGEDRVLVAAHATGCASCGAIIADLEAIRSAAREIPLEEPSPAVWSNIRARLADEGVFVETPGFQGWFRHLGFLSRPVPVAAFACMLVLGCFVTAPQTYFQQDNNAALMTVPARPAMSSMAFAGDSEALEQVVHELEVTFKTRQGSLRPDLKAVYDTSLKSLDASIEECRDSLKGEPGNSLAHDYLLAAYTEKAEVLTSALEFDAGR